MKNTKSKNKCAIFSVARYLAFCAIVVGIVLLCICHTSCQITSEGIKVLNAEESPEIKSVKVLDENSLEVQFTKTVNVKSAAVSKLQDGQKASLDNFGLDTEQAAGIISADGKTVVYNFAQSTTVGQRYQLFSEIKDTRGNTLTFALPFDGYNSRIPLVAMTEVQKNKYKGSKSKNPESAYITLRVLQDGNLAGLEVYSAAQKCSYPLPMVEVKKGEAVTLHLTGTQNLEQCVSELGNDLNLAKTGNAFASTRDIFFLDGKGIGTSADVVLVRERNTNKIIDALSYFSESTSAWKFDSEIAKAVVQGVWSGEPSTNSALNITNISGASPFKRVNIPTAETKNVACKNDWTFTEKKSKK